MIRFDRVGLEYEPGRWALDAVSFRIEPGAFVFLTGHSGAGKSSLLRLVALLDRPTVGEIELGELRYSTLSARRAARERRRMGIVFQDNRLLEDRNVFENVALPLVIGGYRRADIVRRVGAALDRVGLEGAAAQSPRTLSGGERQRVGIARAVVARPHLLLADEPTGNLDAAMSAEIMSLFDDFNRAGVTVLFATHDATLLERFDHPRLVLSGGRLDRRASDAARGSRNAPSPGSPSPTGASPAGARPAPSGDAR